jgi:hypothetical protein
MKRIKQFLPMSMVVLVLLALSVSVTMAQGPVGTAFTYQGRLTNGGSAANGAFDLEFKLYAATSGGGQLGSTNTLNDVGVSNGLFSVTLDFGVSPFTGQALYVQVAVRPGASTGAYTTLAPRQKLSPTPYALFASAPWTTSGTVINYVGGNVGIGTNSPVSKLEIVAQDALTLTGFQPTLTLRDSNASNKRGLLQGANGGVNIYTETGLNTGVVGLTVRDGTGNVGIGTIAPADKLTVMTAPGNYGLTQTDGIATVGTFVGSGAGGGEAGWFGTKTNHPLRFFANNSGAAMTIDTTNKVGIGTLTPSSLLSVAAPGGTLPLTVRQNAAESATPGLTTFETSNGSLGYVGANTNTLVVGASAGKGLGLAVNNTTRAMTIASNGYVGIGTTNINAPLTISGHSLGPDDLAFQVKRSDEAYSLLSVFNNGTVAFGKFAPSTTNSLCYNQVSVALLFFSKCSSAAEYAPTIDAGFGFPETADLVSIAPEIKNPYGDEHAPFVIAKTARACDPNLIGFIVNPESGASGDQVNEHYLPLTIYGYFPAKVTTENGMIKRGDPLTSSSKPGYAMKATGACRIIGYALQDADGEGKIQVYANTGETSIGEVATLREQVKQQDSRIATLEQEIETLQQSQAAQLLEMRQELAALKQQVVNGQPQNETGTGFNLNWLVLGGIALFGIVWVRRGSKEK